METKTELENIKAIFIDDFIKHINKLETENKIVVFVKYNNSGDIVNIYNKIIPANIRYFYNKIQSIKIIEPRQIEFFAIDKMMLLKNKYLHFANMNYNQKICFDISNINAANEWDIIDFDNNYLITKTISSFITNKVWAWIDRGREIWKEGNCFSAF